MMRLTIIATFIALNAFGQDFTSYFTGDTSNFNAVTSGGICLMGGASEHDEAMKWFLVNANGGDVLVIRASGADGYNDYMYSSLGVTINSVESIVFHNKNASYDPYVLTRIMQAEAIWIAGGDQWDYIRYWRNTPVDSLINEAIAVRKIVIGGTSAGMAIMGKYYFTARYGTVTSQTALDNPYDTSVNIDSASFIQNPVLIDVITDTHFDNPDRKGRTITFMARAIMDDNFPLKAIACDEYTAVCIEQDGLAKVYGDYPSHNDNAYFIQPNCELSEMRPENCMPDAPLTWDLSGLAIRVYKVKGTNSGSNTFNLNNWESGAGGTWENWYISNGTKFESPGNQINCTSFSISDITLTERPYSAAPNPFGDVLRISTDEDMKEIIITDACGRRVYTDSSLIEKSVEIQLSLLSGGIYFLTINTARHTYNQKIIKR